MSAVRAAGGLRASRANQTRRAWTQILHSATGRSLSSFAPRKPLAEAAQAEKLVPQQAAQAKAPSPAPEAFLKKKMWAESRRDSRPASRTCSIDEVFIVALYRTPSQSFTNRRLYETSLEICRKKTRKKEPREYTVVRARRRSARRRSSGSRAWHSRTRLRSGIAARRAARKTRPTSRREGDPRTRRSRRVTWPPWRTPALCP